MGTDKAQLPVAGKLLIDHVFAAVRPVATRVVVAGGEPGLASSLASDAPDVDVSWVADTEPGEGPVGGVISSLAGLDASESVLATVSCDLVELDASLLAALRDELIRTDADVSVPLVGGRRQWHTCVWHKRCAPRLAERFAGGSRSFGAATDGLRQTVLITSRYEITDLDTPADVAAFESRAAR